MIKALIFDFNYVIYIDGYNQPLLDFIASLRKNYKIGILTNYSPDGYEHYVVPIKDCFDDIVVSSFVGVAKPHPEIYQIAAERLGVKPPECLYIDDEEYRVDGAKNTGMTGIVYKGFENFKKELAAVLSAGHNG